MRPAFRSAESGPLGAEPLSALAETDSRLRNLGDDPRHRLVRVEPLDLVFSPIVIGSPIRSNSHFGQVGMDLDPLLTDRPAHQIPHETLGRAGILRLNGHRLWIENPVCFHEDG